MLTRDSIAFAVAEAAQRAGAEVVLTSFGRARRLTERSAARLPVPADVLELDVTSVRDLDAICVEVTSRWGGLDGVLHAIGYAPPDALNGRFLETPRESAEAAFSTSAYSLKALTAALLPCLRAAGGGSVVALDLDASRVWPRYDWMGVSKAALEAVGRYLAVYLGPERVRVNLVSCGLLATPASSGFEMFGEFADVWAAATPLGWDKRDASPVADAVVFLLSDRARAITGELLHVDGGAHCVEQMLPDPRSVKREQT